MENFEIITSAQNTQIQLLKKLALKRYRHTEKKFVVENLAIIYDALRDDYDFESLFVTESFIKKNNDKLKFLLLNSRIKKYFLINENLNKTYSQLETPSGITAIYNIKEPKLENNKSVIYLNGISDPGNLGTIIRTSLAFNFVNIVLDETCADIYNAKTINAAKDSVFKINYLSDNNLNWLKENNGSLPVYVANSNSGRSLNEFKPKPNFCLVLGSESHGVSEEIVKLANENIKIEINVKIESLNVAIAAAIILYELNKIDKVNN